MRQIADYQNTPDSLKPITINYNSMESVFKFSNGSFIQLAYLDSVADRYRYQSAEIHILLIDELTHFQYDDYEFLKTRVRSTDERLLRIMCATNPGGVGHGWVKQYFIDVAAPETLWSDNGMSRLFVPAKVDDHPIKRFRDNYKRTLSSIKDDQLRRALLDGDWNTFQGQVFREWNKLHVIDTIPVNLDDCEKFIGFDWGWRDPAVATWIARAPENEFGIRRLYAYREIHENHKTPSWWAATIANIIKDEPIEYMVLPHDCFSTIQGNRTIASVFDDFDVPYARADSMSHAAKMHRIAIMHEYLAECDDGLPGIQFHKHNLVNAIRYIPDLPYSDTRPEEISDKSFDHNYDSVTYALMVIDDQESWLVSPKPPKPDFPQTPWMGQPDGTITSPSLDVGKLLNDVHTQHGRDWRSN